MCIRDRNTDLRLALNRLIDGSLHVANDRQFSDLYHSLLFGEMQRADQYYLLYDFASYAQAYEQIVSAYVDKERWKRMAAMNTAKSGRFSSDRTINEYNELIWHLRKMSERK